MSWQALKFLTKSFNFFKFDLEFLIFFELTEFFLDFLVSKNPS